MRLWYLSICIQSQLDVDSLPHRDHIIVHPLQFLLCSIEGIWRGIKFVGLETLIGEVNLERRIIFLQNRQSVMVLQLKSSPIESADIPMPLNKKIALTSGTLSACALAASVVTVLFTRAVLEKAELRNGAARLVLNARENIVVVLRS
jgi:hypothetical protein